MEAEKIIDLDRFDHGCFNSLPFSQDFCVACGICSSSCLVSGIDGFDPRKLVRMVSLGQKDELVESRWPWICTMCGKCENVCPMEIDIAELVWEIRSLRERDKVPGILHKGLMSALETGNNLRLPKDDFTFILEDVAEEIAEEQGFEGFNVPIDKKGANILTTIHNKLVNTHTDDLKHWWKIFHAAKEDWTVPSENWEGTSWGYFTGDDEGMRVMAGRIVEHMERLDVKTFLGPECGHAYLAIRSGLEKYFPEALKKFSFVTVFDLLIEYIKDRRIVLDRSRFKSLATYHDPCNYGRKAQKKFGHGFFEEPRWIMDQCIENWVELYPTRMHQICCGGGGGALTTGYNEERIFYAKRKFDQIKKTGAQMIVVPCHSCHGQFNNVKKEYGMEALEVKYLSELVADCLVV